MTKECILFYIKIIYFWKKKKKADFFFLALLMTYKAEMRAKGVGQFISHKIYLKPVKTLESSMCNIPSGDSAFHGLSELLVR